MGMTYGFRDGAEYDASDVNNVFAMLFTGGVMPYKTNITQDIDGCVAEITEGGVKGEAMQLLMVDGKVKIGEGAALFSDGSWVIVDADGEFILDSVDAEKYIGLQKNIGTGKVTTIISTTKTADDGNYKYIWLGKTDTSGRLINDAKQAKTELIPNSANVYHEFDMSFDGFGNSTNVAAATKSYKMPHTDYKYLIIRGFENPGIDYYLRGEVADISGTEHTVIYLSRSSNNHRIEIWREGDTLKLAPLAAVHAGTMTFHLVLV